VRVWTTRPIVCVGPKYQYFRYADGVHVPQTGYTSSAKSTASVRLGGQSERVLEPIAPKSVTRAGTTLTIAFECQTPPLTWDRT